MELSLIYNVIILLFFHYFADFVMQSREDAENKSHSMAHLTRHVLIYTIAMTMFVGLYLRLDLVQLSFTAPYFYFIHWAIDYVTSKFSSNAYKKGEVSKFWCIIGFDQFLHQIHIIIYLYLICRL